MSGDEVLVFAVSVCVAIFGWGKQALVTSSIAGPVAQRSGRGLAVVGPLVGLVVIWMVLRTLASFDVREAPGYVALYIWLGLAWMYLGTESYLGMSPWHDVAERGNRAALIAWNGAAVGCAACYAGANVGDGPGWWCVVWAGSLGTVAWWTCWHVLSRVSGLGDHVMLDRDPAAGVRAASYLMASGALFGRGAAGDWTSAAQTVVEMRAAWPVLLLLAKVLVVERAARPKPARPLGSLWRDGLVPAVVDVGLVALGLWLAGPLPDGYPTEVAP